MKKISALILGLCISICLQTVCFGATDSLTNGIHFERGLNWKQIVAKAKKENKYIFVDCFATWCGPCKKMDKEVYPVKEVGSYFNNKFISVKAQMDTGANDDAQTRAFYADAQSIRAIYKVNLYPTLLFFNSDGNLLDRLSGGTDTASLIKFAEDATSPQRDYYRLLGEYNKGRRNLDEMSFLARTAVNVLGDKAQAGNIARQYTLTLNKRDWFRKENIQFMGSFTLKSSDPGFAFFFNNATKINEVMNDEDYSQSVIQRILNNDFVVPNIHDNKSPDWKMISSKIAKKYGQYYARRVTIGERANWAAKQKNWPEHTKYFVSYVEKYGPKNDDGGKWEALALNNYAWEIFIHSNNIAELNIALKWSLRAVTIDPMPDWIDTYANILYKLKKTTLALKWEVVAAVISNHAQAIEANLTKMKAGTPTWGAN